MSKMLCTIIGLLFFMSASISLSNTDSRHWKTAAGETFHAELVNYDPVKDEAILRINEEEDRTFSLEEFSAIDGAWLLEWAKVSNELDELSRKMRGTFSHYQHQGAEYVSDFYVYTPSQYINDKNLPMLILFHPGGKGARYVQRFMRSAEKLGIIIVSSDSFFNSRDDVINDQMFAVLKELLPVIEETVQHDKERLFMGGSSGGAMRAYNYSVSVQRRWAGIFANGGWLGGKENYGKAYPEGMRVVMINGNNDRAANRWIKPDAEVLEARGCKVNVYAFEGGHQVPPPEVQLEALMWLLHGDE